MRPINRLVIHHSASPRSVSAATIRGWHTDKGWSDIGYHLVIEGDGTPIWGRSIDKVGAHAKGHNGDSIGVCVVGDNTNPDRCWTETQKRVLHRTVEYFESLYPNIELYGHRDLPGAATLCPGLDIRSLGFVVGVVAGQ